MHKNVCSNVKISVHGLAMGVIVVKGEVKKCRFHVQKKISVKKFFDLNSKKFLPYISFLRKFIEPSSSDKGVRPMFSCPNYGTETFSLKFKQQY